MTLAFRVASSSLNQMPLAWRSNLDNIMASIRHASEAGCHFRPGVELELCGVDCGVHFHDSDFNDRMWRSILAIINSGLTESLPVEVGTALQHKGLVYSCLIAIYKNQVMYVRPANFVKTDADKPSNQFVSEWTPRSRPDFVALPSSLGAFNNFGKRIPIGNYFLDINGVKVYSVFEAEVKSDLFSRAIKAKADLICVGYTRAFELGKAARILANLAQQSDSVRFAVSSVAGTESPKTLFEGGSWLIDGGKVYQLTESLSLERNQHSSFEIQVKIEGRRKSESSSWIPVVVKLKKEAPLKTLTDVDDGLTNDHHRSVGKPHDTPSNTNHTTAPGNPNPQPPGPEVGPTDAPYQSSTEPGSPKHSYSLRTELGAEATLLKAMSAFLFHTLVESRACGFFLPLSGGADSSLTLCVVHYLSKRVTEASEAVKSAMRDIVGRPDLDCASPTAITGALLYTAYLPMNFSGRTRALAKALSARAGCTLYEVNINGIFQSFKKTVEETLDVEADFSLVDGRPTPENIALQNLQARIRLVTTYLAAQLLHKRVKLRSYLLTLATGNLSEVVRGYFTKYDNSSGDVNVLGSLQKTEIKAILEFLSGLWPEFDMLAEVASQAPTAELIPADQGRPAQTDENDMGLTYEQLDYLTQMVKEKYLWGNDLVDAYNARFKTESGREVVERFLRFFKANRHKLLTLPPTVHLTKLDLDGRFDLRPTMYKEDDLLGKRPAM